MKTGKKGGLYRVIVRIIISIIAVYVVDIIIYRTAGQGFVGVNPLTVGITAALGLPGMVILYVIGLLSFYL